MPTTSSPPLLHTHTGTSMMGILTKRECWSLVENYKKASGLILKGSSHLRELLQAKQRLWWLGFYSKATRSNRKGGGGSAFTVSALWPEAIDPSVEIMLASCCLTELALNAKLRTKFWIARAVVQTWRGIDCLITVKPDCSIFCKKTSVFLQKLKSCSSRIRNDFDPNNIL